MPRKRSATAHRKVLDAALELVAECGIEGTSMDAIARKSGVSKATIYKHWADKETLLLEMMADVTGISGRPSFDSGFIKSDMVDVLSYRPPEHAELRERIGQHFVAYGARNREFGRAWRKMVMEPPRRELKHLIGAGIKKKELSPGIDLDLALGLLLGPMLYWHIFFKGTTEDPRHMAELVVEAFWRAYGLKKAPYAYPSSRAGSEK